jgi:flagellar hook assembly protein FlgD
VGSQIIPVSFQVYPVPFKDNLTITYAISKNQKINLSIYDVLGRKVRCIKDGMEKSGFYRITWDGRDGSGKRASSGVYFCKLETEDSKEIKKIILIR